MGSIASQSTIDEPGRVMLNCVCANEEKEEKGVKILCTKKKFLKNGCLPIIFVYIIERSHIKDLNFMKISHLQHAIFSKKDRIFNMRSLDKYKLLIFIKRSYLENAILGQNKIFISAFNFHFLSTKISICKENAVRSLNKIRSYF